MHSYSKTKENKKAEIETKGAMKRWVCKKMVNFAGMEKLFYRLLVVLCLFSTARASGKSIGARLALENSLMELTSATRTNASMSQLQLVEQREYNGAVSLYIFSSPSMYVIASGNDNGPGLLAYSLEGGFSSEMSPSMEWWLDQCSRYIGMADVSVESAGKGNRGAIAPMLTSEWDQCAPYNNLLPLHSGNVPYTGCVATAMAQIMRYHEWPERGEGAIQWTCNRDYSSHDHYFNFEEVAFDWRNMLDRYDDGATTEQNNAVAGLMRACGAAAEMQYGYGASGSFLYLAASGLAGHLKYDCGMEYLESKWFGTPEEWDEICYAELSEGRPILYGGENDVRHTRHAFVVDGYCEDGLYHVNWGFGGENNGYFKLTDLSYPGGNYRLNHSLVRGIRPETEASSFLPAISVEGEFRTDETQYFRSADVDIWFMEEFRNVALTDFWYVHGVKCVPVDGSAEFYVSCEGEQWYRPRGVNRFYTIAADRFPVGTYHLYPVFKTATTEWLPCYRDCSKEERCIRFEVTETGIKSSTASVDDVRVDDVKDDVYYDLLGNIVLNPQHGIFIKVRNGKAIKVKM